MIQALGARCCATPAARSCTGTASTCPLRLSVNLSGAAAAARQLALGGRGGARRAAGFPQRHLDLEITESVIITHPEKAVNTLVRLQADGRVGHVDDFGTGYSSLSYLARLPIQGVKIDQRFVHGLEKNRNDEAITQAIIALSHSLGLRCIAEGVETPRSSTSSRSHGCEEAQGFLISHPLSRSGAALVVAHPGRASPVERPAGGSVAERD
jgi:EAL domain-containing protein (putative c-di-GMP-specific phosphodiesterase class I)